MYGKGPNRPEGLRVSIKEQLQSKSELKIRQCIDSGMTLAEVVRLLGAEQFVRIREDDVRATYDIDIAGYLAHQLASQTTLLLPERIVVDDEIYAEPDDTVRAFGVAKDFGSGSGLDERKIVPRSNYLLQVLTELGVPSELHVGKTKKGAKKTARSLSYQIYLLPTLRKLVRVNDEEGEATLIVHDVDVHNEEEWKLYARMSKRTLEALGVEKATRISYPEHPREEEGKAAVWKAEIARALTDESVRQPVAEELSAAVEETWPTKNAAATMLGISRNFLEKLTKKYESSHPGGTKKVTRHATVATFYDPSFLEVLKRDVDALKERRAPEGWRTYVEFADDLAQQFPKAVYGVDEKGLASHVRVELKKLQRQLKKPDEFVLEDDLVLDDSLRLSPHLRLPNQEKPPLSELAVIDLDAEFRQFFNPTTGEDAYYYSPRLQKHIFDSVATLFEQKKNMTESALKWRSFSDMAALVKLREPDCDIEAVQTDLYRIAKKWFPSWKEGVDYDRLPGRRLSPVINVNQDVADIMLDEYFRGLKEKKERPKAPEGFVPLRYFVRHLKEATGSALGETHIELQVKKVMKERLGVVEGTPEYTKYIFSLDAEATEYVLGISAAVADRVTQVLGPKLEKKVNTPDAPSDWQSRSIIESRLRPLYPVSEVTDSALEQRINSEWKLCAPLFVPEKDFGLRKFDEEKTNRKMVREFCAPAMSQRIIESILAKYPPS